MAQSLYCVHTLLPYVEQVTKSTQGPVENGDCMPRKEIFPNKRYTDNTNST